MAHHLFHGVDHGAGAQEQHRLEEGMGHQVEDAGDGGSTAHGQHHVTELGHGAVGQALLQIHLGEGDRCSQEAGNRSHHSDHGLHHRELGVERIQSCDQEHARCHHRGGVNQGRNRRGALHGIRQPDVERELG